VAENNRELELQIFTGTIDMLKAIFGRGVPVPGVERFRVEIDPLVSNLIIANLEFLRPVFEERIKDGMGRTKKEE
jgi:hypothetical protein